MLFEKYMARFAKAEIDARFAALVAFFANQEAKQETKAASSRAITYSNIGKTPETINAIRATNQCNSPLLKLPAERVHGMVYREISENRILSLAHACSCLHDVLYPTFLSQEAFVIKISSLDPGVAASELTQ